MNLDPTEYKEISRATKSADTVITDGQFSIGDDRFVIFAGPCRSESPTQIMESAHAVKEAGAHVLRGGAFKPCTHPHCNWGGGVQALEWMKEAGEKYGLPIITEAMSLEQLELIYPLTDIIQVGTRNGQNYEFLKELGRFPKPIMLKRGTWMNLRETLCAAEWAYFSDEERGVVGNKQVFLCERGTVHFNDHMRWTLDFAMIPSFKKESHLPIIVDISHGTGGPGNAAYYQDLARAAVAVGAHGLMVEIHPDPKKSMSDADQTIGLQEFKDLVDYIRPVIDAVGKKI